MDYSNFSPNIQKKSSPVKQTPANFGHLGYSGRDS